MLENFKPSLRRLLFHAKQLAWAHGCEEIGPADLAGSLLYETSPELAEVFRRSSISPRQMQAALQDARWGPEPEADAGEVDEEFDFQRELQGELERAQEEPRTLPFSAAAQEALQLARDEAQRLAHAEVGPEHLLLGLLRQRHPKAGLVLESLGLQLLEVRELVVLMAKGEIAVARPGDPVAELVPSGLAGEVCEEALELPEEERRLVIRALVASLSRHWQLVDDYEAAWTARLRRDLPGLDPAIQLDTYWGAVFSEVLKARRERGA